MRYGGVIGLCVPKGIDLPKELKTSLENLKIELNGITHDVGFVDITLDDNIKNFSDEEIEEVIQEFFDQMDSDWMKKRSQFVIGKDEIFNLFVKKLKEGTAQINEEELQDSDIRKQLELLLSYFINGVRGKARREKLRSVLSEKSDADNDKKQIILSFLAEYENNQNQSNNF